MKINPYPFPFIAIEGIDDCGKTTLIEGFKKLWPDPDSVEGFLFTKEPTDGEYGRKIRKILNNNGYDENGRKLVPGELQRLYIQDRLEHRQSETVFLEKYPIISDRDFLSTFAYGIAEGLDLGWIFLEHEKILGDYFFVPDMIIILDLSAEEAEERSRKSGKKMDHFEKEIQFRNKLRRVYLSLSQMPRWNGVINLNVRIIDASPAPKKILNCVLPLLTDVLKKKYSQLVKKS